MFITAEQLVHCKVTIKPQQISAQTSCNGSELRRNTRPDLLFSTRMPPSRRTVRTLLMMISTSVSSPPSPRCTVTSHCKRLWLKRRKVNMQVERTQKGEPLKGCVTPLPNVLQVSEGEDGRTLKTSTVRLRRSRSS